MDSSLPSVALFALESLLRMSDVLFALGSNIGRPRLQLASAVEQLRTVVEGVRLSGLYRTEPIGFTQQPDFYNIVVVGSSTQTPERLLGEALRIERELGRVRTFPNAPRTIDIDLLASGDTVVDSARLTLPHPRLHERPFVLAPLAEVFPDWRHPTLELTAAEMLERLPQRARVERVGELTSRG